jgi:hypothetical protein
MRVNWQCLALTLVALGRRKAELHVLCKASFGSAIHPTLQSRRRYKKLKRIMSAVHGEW